MLLSAQSSETKHTSQRGLLRGVPLSIWEDLEEQK